MKTILKTDSLGLTKAIKLAGVSLIAGAMLAACGGSGAGTSGERSAFEVEGDHAIGKADAPITVVEYASVTCVHCASWHESVWPKMQSDYIDTGKVRFVYREFPTPPQNLAMAGFLIANCADESKFFANIGLQYERQDALMAGARAGRAKQDYEALAKAAGLNEEAYMACLQNEEERNRLESVIRGGMEAGVQATPSFFINGVKKDVFKIEDFDKEFAAFVDVPKREDAGDETHSE